MLVSRCGQTKHNYKYQDTDTTGHWYQLALENEDSSRHSCSKTGDGTVPYHSLSWAHTWLGDRDAVVDVTQVPQSVYFSEDNTRAFQALRDSESHHAEYKLHGRSQPMCSASDDGSTSHGAATNSASITPSFFEGFFKSSTLDQITFFERKVASADGSTTQTVRTRCLASLLINGWTEVLTLLLVSVYDS